MIKKEDLTQSLIKKEDLTQSLIKKEDLTQSLIKKEDLTQSLIKEDLTPPIRLFTLAYVCRQMSPSNLPVSGRLLHSSRALTIYNTFDQL